MLQNTNANHHHHHHHHNDIDDLVQARLALGTPGLSNGPGIYPAGFDGYGGGRHLIELGARDRDEFDEFGRLRRRGLLAGLLGDLDLGIL